MFAPNTFTENLMQRKKTQAAMVLDSLFAADLQAWPSMDFSTIKHYLKMSGIVMGESILKKGLYDLAQIGVLALRKIMTRAKGRPAWNYRIKSLADIALILGVKLHQNEAKDAIPLTSFKSAKAYRAGKHYGLLKRLGVSQLSRKKLGARLGVGGRSTFNYEIGMDLTVTQRTERHELTIADVPHAPEKRLNANVFLEVEIEREMTEDELRIVYKDFDEAYLLIGNRKTKETRYMPYTRYILKRELELGHKVYKVKQITNEYRVA